MHPASPTSEWRDHLRALGAPGLVAALVVVLHAVWVLVGWPAGGHRALVSDVALTLAFVAPMVGALVSARRTDDWRERRAWHLFAASYLTLVVANASWLGGKFAYGTQLSLVGEWLVCLSYVPLFLGLGSFPMAPRRRDARLRSALDVGAVVLSAGLIVWYSIGRSSSVSRSPIGYLPATADVGVIAMIVLLLMRAPDRRMRAVLGLFAGGHLVSVLAGLASVVVQRSATRPQAWVDVLWMASDALIFCGTIYHTSMRKREEMPARAPVNATDSCLRAAVSRDPRGAHVRVRRGRRGARDTLESRHSLSRQAVHARCARERGASLARAQHRGRGCMTVRWCPKPDGQKRSRPSRETTSVSAALPRRATIVRLAAP